MKTVTTSTSEVGGNLLLVMLSLIAMRTPPPLESLSLQ